MVGDRSGVAPGDRVVSYMPNIPETITAFLACASLGAIWSSCSPDMGSGAVIDRFKQIEPKVLFAVDGYRYGGRDFDCRPAIQELVRAMPTLSASSAAAPDPDAAPTRSERTPVGQLAGRRPARFAQVDFDHRCGSSTRRHDWLASRTATAASSSRPRLAFHPAFGRATGSAG
jgi:acetoacetyl-CoA synthetase